MNNKIDDLILIIKAKDEKIDELVGKIQITEDKFVKVVQDNVALKSENLGLRNEIQNVGVRVDDLQQYDRKECLRIEGLPYVKDETKEQLLDTIIKSFQNKGARIAKSDVYRLHRSGKPIKNKRGLLVQQVIVRFQTWDARQMAFNTRYNNDSGRKTDGVFDLTRRRLDLLKSAKYQLLDHPNCHVYANSECLLIFKDRKNNEKHSFNTSEELERLLRIHSQ